MHIHPICHGIRQGTLADLHGGQIASKFLDECNQLRNLLLSNQIHLQIKMSALLGQFGRYRLRFLSALFIELTSPFPVDVSPDGTLPVARAGHVRAV